MLSNISSCYCGCLFILRKYPENQHKCLYYKLRTLIICGVDYFNSYGYVVENIAYLRNCNSCAFKKDFATAQEYAISQECIDGGVSKLSTAPMVKGR